LATPQTNFFAEFELPTSSSESDHFPPSYGQNVFSIFASLTLTFDLWPFNLFEPIR